MIENIENLEDLLAAMKDHDPRVLDHPPDQWSSELPTFGGDAPPDTSSVWSWDETRLLIGEHAGNLEIVGRKEWLDIGNCCEECDEPDPDLAYEERRDDGDMRDDDDV